MKHFTFLILFSLTTVLLSSCNDDRETLDLTTITGKWRWVSSTGGLGQDETPDSTGKTITLEITDSRVKLYQNGNLISDKSYDIIFTDPHGTSGALPMLAFEDGSKQSYEIIENKLKLYDAFCIDCHNHTYIKIANQ